MVKVPVLCGTKKKTASVKITIRAKTSKMMPFTSVDEAQDKKEGDRYFVILSPPPALICLDPRFGDFGNRPFRPF